MDAFIWVIAAFISLKLCLGLMLTWGLGRVYPVRVPLARAGIILLGLAFPMFGVLAPQTTNWGGFVLPMLIPPLIAGIIWAIIARKEVLN